MALPVIKYTPKSGVEQTVNFPSELTIYDPNFARRSSHVMTEGNVVAKGLLADYSLVHISIDSFNDQQFFDAMVAFWSHAAPGGSFTFFHDGALTAIDLFKGDNPPGGAITVYVGIAVDNERTRWAYCLHTRDRNSFVVTNTTFDPETYLIHPGRANTFHDLDPITDKDTFIRALTISGAFPIKRKPGNLMTFDMVFRDFAEIVVA